MVGGWLCDRYGRKFIYTYDLLVYMVGVLLAVVRGQLRDAARGLRCSPGWRWVPACRRRGPTSPRRRPPRSGPSTSGPRSSAWSIGPMVGFALAILVVPLGLLGSRLIFAAPVRGRVRDLVAAPGAAASRRLDRGRRTHRRGTGPHRRRRGAAVATHQRDGAAVPASASTASGTSSPARPGSSCRGCTTPAGFASPAGQNALQVLVWGCTALATWFGFMRFADRMDRRNALRHRCAMGVVAWALLAYAASSTRGAAGVRRRLGHLGRHRRAGVLQRVDQRAVRDPLSRHGAGRAVLRRARGSRRCSATCSRPCSPSRACRSSAR